MKKHELTELIQNKIILQESLDIVNEVRNQINENKFQPTNLNTHYHGNYLGELVRILHNIDMLSDDLNKNMSIAKIETKNTEKIDDILKQYKSFMSNYHSFLVELKKNSNDLDMF